MAHKPRRRSLRDRIWALLGIRSQPRLNSLFTEDLPQNHMQWMEEPQYLNYVESLESHLQADTAPSTSKASKESHQLGNNAGLQSTKSLHKSSSFMSLCHWTSTSMSPLERFYCATVAPFDVDHLSEGQTFPEDRPGRPSCSRRRGASSVSLRNIKSDLDCTSRFLVPFDNSTRLHIDDISNEILQSPRDIQFLESGEACARESIITTKRKAHESYRLPLSKDKLNHVEGVEARGTAEAVSHKGRVRLSAKKDACPGSNGGKSKREGSDVAIRFCDNKVSLTLKESCKQIIIRSKNCSQCCHNNDGGVDCNNVIRVDPGKKEELATTNKANISINLVGDCVMININMPTDEKLSKDGRPYASFSKLSSEFQESNVSQAFHCQRKNDDYECVNKNKEVQTDIVDSEGIRIALGSMPSSHVSPAAEHMQTTKNGEVSFQSGHFQKDGVGEHVKNNGVAGGSVDGEAQAKKDLNAFHTRRYGHLEVEVVNSAQEEREEGQKEEEKQEDSREEVRVNTDDFEAIDGLSEWCSAIGQCHFNGRQSHLTMSSDSECATTDDCFHLDIDTGVTKHEDAKSPICQLPAADLSRDNVAGTSEYRGTAQLQHKLSDNLKEGSGDDKGRVNQKTVFCVDKAGVVDAFLLVQIPHRVTLPGVQVIANYRPRQESVGRLQDDVGQLERELEECRLQLGHVSRCISALKQEVSEARNALATVCDVSAMPSIDSSSLRTLEPTCYKKYQNIRSTADTRRTLQLVRDHTKVLSDLEVLIYRKHLVLLQVLPDAPTQPVPQPKRYSDIDRDKESTSLHSGQALKCPVTPKRCRASIRGCLSSYKALNSKNKEQAENGQEQKDNVTIEIVSVTAEINRCSKEATSGGSPSISTLLSISSEGGTSSQYLTDTEV